MKVEETYQKEKLININKGDDVEDGTEDDDEDECVDNNPIAIALKKMVKTNEEKIEQIHKYQIELEEEEMELNLLLETGCKTAYLGEMRKVLVDLQLDCDNLDDSICNEQIVLDNFHKDVQMSLVSLDEADQKWRQIRHVREEQFNEMIEVQATILDPVIAMREGYFFANEDILSSHYNIEHIKQASPSGSVHKVQVQAQGNGITEISKCDNCDIFTVFEQNNDNVNEDCQHQPQHLHQHQQGRIESMRLRLKQSTNDLCTAQEELSHLEMMYPNR